MLDVPAEGSARACRDGRWADLLGSALGRVQGVGVRSSVWMDTGQDKAGGEFVSRGLISWCFAVAAGGVSPALAPAVLGLRVDLDRVLGRKSSLWGW